MKKIIICLVVIQSAYALYSSDLKIPKLSSTPAIDGKLNEDSWKNALHIKSLKPYDPKKPVSQKTEAFLGYDSEFLYIAVICYEEQMSKLKKNIKTRDGKLWTDDCVEIFLSTGKDTKTHYYCYHMILNPLGTKYDASKSLSNRNIHTTDEKWDGAWLGVSSIGKDRWMCEIAIPFCILDIGDGDWKINVCREEKPSNELSVTQGKFFAPDKFAVIKGMKLDLSKYTVIIDDFKFSSIGLGNNSFTSRIRNKKSSAKTVIADTKVLDPSGKKVFGEQKKINVAGGKTTKVASSFDLPEIGIEYSLVFSLLDPKSKQVISQKSRNMKIDSVLEAKLACRILYLSEKILQVSLKTNLGEKTLKECVLEVSITPVNGKNSLYNKSFALKNTEIILDLPVGTLNPGKYAVNLDIKYKNGKIIEKKILDFEKIKGPFE